MTSAWKLKCFLVLKKIWCTQGRFEYCLCIRGICEETVTVLSIIWVPVMHNSPLFCLFQNILDVSSYEKRCYNSKAYKFVLIVSEKNPSTASSVLAFLHYFLHKLMLPLHVCFEVAPKSSYLFSKYGKLPSL